MSITHKISAYNRRRKWNTFLEIIKPSHYTTILDVGFAENEYSETDNFLEKNYPYPHNITALGINTPKIFLERYPRIKAVKYDGGKFPFGDKEFDICWSNAVIEHVGNREKQLMFLEEIKRVAKIAFITTPNKHFPFEVHTRTPLLHFLPKKCFDKYLFFIGKTWAAGDYMNLLSYKDIRKLLKKAEINNYEIIKNRLLFTLDFVVIFD
jgi:SAM-dependent methyltransferase